MVRAHAGEEYEDTTFGRLVKDDYFRVKTQKEELGRLWIKVSENLKNNARPANRTSNPKKPLRTFLPRIGTFLYSFRHPKFQDAKPGLKVLYTFQDADPVLKVLYAPTP